MKTKYIIICILMCLGGSPLVAQQVYPQVGFQIKPIMPRELYFNGKVGDNRQGVGFGLTSRPGISGGILARYFVWEKTGFETGLNYAHQNFRFSMSYQTDEYEFSTSNTFSYSAIEMPLKLIISLNLWDDFYMTTGIGSSLNYYPKNMEFFKSEIDLAIKRNSSFQLGIMGNTGIEFRLENGSAFNIGASYHRPIKPVYEAIVLYHPPGQVIDKNIAVRPSYITIDFRYYLPNGTFFKTDDPYNPDK